MDDCTSTDSLRNYYYDYYNFCPSTKSFYSDNFSTDATLQAELSGLILKDMDMVEYVQHVYGASKADIEYIRSKGWQIEGLSTYTKLLDEDAKEEDLYGSFKTMMDGLFSTFTGDGLKLDVHYVSLGKTTLKSIGNVRKPEQLFFFGLHNDKSPVTWSLTKAFIELAVTPLTQRIAACNPTVATINEERTTTTTEVLTNSAADLVPLPMFTSRPGTKRKRRSTDTLDEPTPALEHPKTCAYFKKESQAAGYALELLASTCRRWATGVVITDTEVTLHYYDRMGAIFTKPFKFDEEPWKLALFALAIGQCNLVQAGFEPLVAYNVDAMLSQSLGSLNGAVLKVPKEASNEGSVTRGDGTNGIKFVDNLGRGVYSHFQITGDPLYIYGGLTGKGSHVLPGYLVRMEGKGATDDQTEEPIIPVNAKGSMVAKLSWPMEERPFLEAQIINTLANKIPWIKRHLPKIHCALTIKDESMGLPRHLFHNMITAHKLEQRYFTLLFTDCYEHLWNIKTLDDFQVVYIGIVECHYNASRYGKMLHRDISENNLLWTRKAKEVVGVLNDWDLSTRVNVVGSSTNHRTGTGPFMALDLLGKEPPIHLYRHDLESLFYVLIWAAVHYNIGAKVPYSHTVDPALEKWNGDFEEARLAKLAFFSDAESVLEHLQPVFEPLRETWIEPLVDLFRKARANANLLARAKKGGQTSKRPARKPRKLQKYSDDESDEERIDADSEEDPVSSPPPTAQSLAVNVDFATLGGYLTFENFMKALDGWEPSGVPKKYREYAERLLEEEPVTATTPSSTAKSPGY
ncbi:Protein kinase domain-containing protein [Pleurotus pulmonarius]